MKTKLWPIAIVLMVVGVIARIYIILHAGSWWFDESVAQAFAKIPIFQSWQYLKYENNPPLYYWLLRLWGLLFGFQEISLRSLSVVLGILTMLATIRLGRELFNERVGLWVGAMYAVASLAIFLDTEARMYSMLGLCIALSYYYLLKILFKEPTRLEVVLFIATTTLALYTNITGLWISLTQVIIIAFIKPNMGRIKAAMYAMVPVVLFSPWLIAFALERVSFAKYIPAGSWWYFGGAVPFLTFFVEPSVFFNFWSVAIEWVAEISLVASMVVLGWFLHHAWKRRKVPEEKLTVATLGLMVPLFFSLIIALNSPRYFYQSAIFFWIILAYGIEKISEQVGSKFALGALMVAVVGYAVFNLQYALQGSLHGNWDAAAQWIDAQHADVMLAMPKLWAAAVYSSSTPFYFLPPPIMSLQNTSPPLNPLQMVTQYNYNWGSVDYQLTSGQGAVLYAEIANATASTSKIIFGYQGGTAQETILADVQALGFQRGPDFKIEGYDAETIAVFNRSSR